MAVTAPPPTPQEHAAPPSLQSQAFWCFFYGCGLIGTLIIYGLLQERIMQIGYGSDAAMFSYSVFLIFCNRLAAVMYAACMAVALREGLRNNAPLWKYSIVSLASVFSSTCQYEALKYVSFVVQMLGKSFKMLPVMVWGMLISQKHYGIRDWGIALCVTGGVTEFLCTGPTAASTETSSVKGFMFLLGFLALDGLTSTMQEKLFTEHKTSKYNQMMYINFVSACISMITLLATGTIAPSLAFCGEYPIFIFDVVCLSCSAVASQFFIYSQVKEFGALVFAATMNVRQVVSIIVSYITYHHHITGWQVLGLLIVFSALFYKAYLGIRKQQDDAQALLKQQDAQQYEDTTQGGRVPPEVAPETRRAA